MSREGYSSEPEEFIASLKEKLEEKEAEIGRLKEQMNYVCKIKNNDIVTTLSIQEIVNLLQLKARIKLRLENLRNQRQTPNADQKRVELMIGFAESLLMEI